MNERVLLAGASGHLGKHIAAELRRRGFRIRAIARDSSRLDQSTVDEVVTADITSPRSLERACHDVDFVISCAGAVMDIGRFGDRHSFYDVDYRGNSNLLDEARRSGVRKFIYVSLAHAGKLRQTEYANAHEQFVDALRSSGMSYCVVRPTGFYCFLAELVKFAKKGRGIIIGSGEYHTNPVHEADVAKACVDVTEGTATEYEIGGPEVFTRKQLTELAFQALGTEPKLTRVSPGIFKTLILPLRLFNRRVYSLMEFGIAVTQLDVIAASKGTQPLRAYFEQVARGL
ncbi:MAG: SDR family oxidoreductase [Acidobacteriota bacterium]